MIPLKQYPELEYNYNTRTSIATISYSNSSYWEAEEKYDTYGIDNGRTPQDYRWEIISHTYNRLDCIYLLNYMEGLAIKDNYRIIDYSINFIPDSRLYPLSQTYEDFAFDSLLEVVQDLKAWILQLNEPAFITTMSFEMIKIGKNQRKPISDKVRYKVFKRDNYTCQICGRTQKDGVKLHIDHIKPVAKGGTNNIDNLRVLCAECNMGKSDDY